MARYEKTIATHHYITEITLPGTPTLVYDLMDAPTKATMDKYLATLDVLDGYILSAGGFLVRTDPSGVAEPVDANVQYTCPVENWITKTYVSGSGVAIVRVFVN